MKDKPTCRQMENSKSSKFLLIKFIKKIVETIFYKNVVTSVFKLINNSKMHIKVIFSILLFFLFYNSTYCFTNCDKTKKRPTNEIFYQISRNFTTKEKNIITDSIICTNRTRHMLEI